MLGHFYLYIKLIKKEDDENFRKEDYIKVLLQFAKDKNLTFIETKKPNK